MNTPICSALEKLNKDGRVRFHMPGHKGTEETWGSSLAPFDITEITGYDNLHDPRGIIRKSMDILKEIYHTRESWYLVNGSTAGILAALSSCCYKGDRIIMARNCHRAVYNAVRLLHLHPVYLFPEIDLVDGICGHIDSEDVRRLADRYHDIRACLITSPTYEGVVSDIRAISEVCRKTGIILIVDEAHGAHFPFHEYFPESAVNIGADLVIQSLHKTLPCMTQTAVLHLCSDKVSSRKVQDYLSVYQTSSPSYLLMASAEYGVVYSHDNKVQMDSYVDNLNWFRGKCDQFSHIHLVMNAAGRYYDYDRGKLVLSCPGRGRDLFERLYRDYHIEVEMANIHYIIAMTSICDRKEDYEKLFCALMKIDQEYNKGPELRKNPGFEFRKPTQYGHYIKNPVRFESWECEGKDRAYVRIEEAQGRIAFDTIMIYPPGIPMIVAGEIISKELIREIQSYTRQGFEVLGMRNGSIPVIAED